jgi:transcriptional regulator with XRE-family HTH domain
MKKIPIINQIIKDKKKELKINQVEFAELLQKSLSTIKKYDSGFPIPLDTLIIISNKLGLDLVELVSSQLQENTINGTDYYTEIIKKDLHNKKDSLIGQQLQSEALEIRLQSLFEFYILTKEKPPIFDIKGHINFSDGKFFIKDDNKQTVFMFTEKQVTELTEHIKDYIDYFIFKCQKENLNK